MQLSSRTPHCATLDLTSCLCAGLTHYGQHVVPASTRTTKPVYKPSICLEDSEQTSFSHTSARKTLSSANSILMSLWLVTWNIILFAVQPWRRGELLSLSIGTPSPPPVCQPGPSSTPSSWHPSRSSCSSSWIAVSYQKSSLQNRSMGRSFSTYFSRLQEPTVTPCTGSG